MAIQVIILAAGQGKRMRSTLPKVLHPLAGKPLLEHVVDVASQLSSTRLPIVIHGHQGALLRDMFSHRDLQWVEQTEQQGTGHAVLQALPTIADDDQVLVLCGDVPLLSVDTLKQLIAATQPATLGMLTANLIQPTGYGRILRDKQRRIMRIVEEKDASDDERTITEINTGVYLVPATCLKKWLPLLENKNKQNEYYLTDIIALAAQESIAIQAVQPAHVEEILGVNDRGQLAQLERFYQRMAAQQLMRRGVTLSDPARLDIRGEVQVGHDICIDVNVILEGRVVIGDGCVIGSNTILRNVTLGEGVEVKANSVLDGAEIASHAIIGPFARLRPGTILAPNTHVGNFVELKNSQVGEGSKINHLSYIGDSELGHHVNVGAGTITCNYDGVNKHKTIIGDRVHIGSDTQLVAPVTIGEGATIGAGSTVTKDAPAQQLTLTHQLEQRSVKQWQRPVKKDKVS